MALKPVASAATAGANNRLKKRLGWLLLVLILYHWMWSPPRIAPEEKGSPQEEEETGILIASSSETHSDGRVGGSLIGIAKTETDDAEAFHNNNTTRQQDFGACDANKVLPGPKTGPFMMHQPSKLRLAYSHKAGATVAIQLIFRQAGLCSSPTCPEGAKGSRMGLAKEHGLLPRTRQCNPCTLDDWTCIKLVRSPLDRIVSSYLHVMKYMGWSWLKSGIAELNITAQAAGRHPWNATFADFVHALDYLPDRQPPGMYAAGETHFLAQTSTHSECPGSLLIPTETMHEGLEYVRQKTKGKIALNATGLTSGHYVPKVETAVAVEEDATNVPWTGQLTGPQDYQSYFGNEELNSVICRLLCLDLQQYGAACSASWVASTSQTNQQCVHEKARVGRICGPSFADSIFVGADPTG